MMCISACVQDRFLSVPNQPMMRVGPKILINNFHQLHFRFQNIGSMCEAQSVCDAKHMRIHSNRIHAERIGQHDVCRFPPDARQRYQRIEIFRHFPVIFVRENLRSFDDIGGFRFRKSARTMIPRKRSSPNCRSFRGCPLR